MNINRGNPAGYEVIVDSWPKFKAVLTRPRREVALDNSDLYANVYTAFYHDFDVYRSVILDTDVINWAQTFRIQGNQDGVYQVSQNAAAIKKVQLSATFYITYLHPNPNKLAVHQLDPGFTLSTLNASHVQLLNETWPYGGNEQSRRFLANMVQYFFSACILDPDGQPISWSVMDPLGAMGHGYTLPAHRRKHYLAVAGRSLAMKAHAAGYPIYGHVALDNFHMQGINERRGYQKLSELCHICSIHPEI
ncbi:glycine N-acyltransferase-like protein 3 isoform X2 [Sceloporus undulatus]|nr:glycine N-acyltransferase-like protein 3 isoform X2 [Sceloporus undulatus]XP_042300351.1 glycine N-acyltransferase-like protein 3 isoform X2 [Sceloporus undulatus]